MNIIDPILYLVLMALPEYNPEDIFIQRIIREGGVIKVDVKIHKVAYTGREYSVLDTLTFDPEDIRAAREKVGYFEERFPRFVEIKFPNSG